MLTRHYALQKQMGQTEGVLKGLREEPARGGAEPRAARRRTCTRPREDLARVRERLRVAGRARTDAARRRALAAGWRTRRRRPRARSAHGQADRDGARGAGAPAEPASWRRCEQRGRGARPGAHGAAGEGGRRQPSAAEAARRQLGELLAASVEELPSAVHAPGGTAREGEPRLTELQAPHRRRPRRAAPAGCSELAEDTAAGSRSGRTAHTEETARGARAGRRSLRELRGRGWTSSRRGSPQISLRERELVLELEHLVGADARAAPGRPRRGAAPLPPAAAAGRRARSRSSKDLRAQVERMGEINLTAIDEHAGADGALRLPLRRRRRTSRRRSSSCARRSRRSTAPAASASSRPSTW